MNLRESYQRLFKSRPSSNDALLLESSRKPLTEAQTLKGKVGEFEFINWVNSWNTQAGDEIYEIDTTAMDSFDVANEYDTILKKYKIPGDIEDVKLDREGYISWIKIK
jgi:hypothetical protein